MDPIYVQFPVSEQEYLRWSRRGALAGGPNGPRDLELTLADGTTYPHRGTAEILDANARREWAERLGLSDDLQRLIAEGEQP